MDFTEARDSEWQWHQLGHMQVCTSLQTDNHASTPPLSFLQAGCPSCRPTNSVIAFPSLLVLNTACRFGVEVCLAAHAASEKNESVAKVGADHIHLVPMISEVEGTRPTGHAGGCAYGWLRSRIEVRPTA